jgi:hypothetical protein
MAEHVEEVHSAADYQQRRAIVDELGWEPFTQWFYEQDFRNWWQVIYSNSLRLFKPVLRIRSIFVWFRILLFKQPNYQSGCMLIT